VAAAIYGVALGASSLPAQRPAPALEPIAQSERYVANVPVSGGLRVGVMVIPRRERPDADSLYVILPLTGKSTLCAEVSSRDGRYEARLEYSLAAGDSGGIWLKFRSRHRSQIKDLEADELAILAHLAEKCDGNVETFVVASWDAITVPDTVIVFLNSRVPTFVIAVKAREKQDETRCAELSQTTTAFNLRCAIPYAWITSSNTLYVRKRERRGARTAIVDTPLPLRQ
jgi:hypothetical protein